MKSGIIFVESESHYTLLLNLSTNNKMLGLVKYVVSTSLMVFYKKCIIGRLEIILTLFYYKQCTVILNMVSQCSPD